MSEKIKPELLPADLGAGDIQFIKRADYARRTAETVALRLKAEVKKDHVMQILSALDGGQQELPGDNPEPIVKLFEVVKEDYNAGIEEVKRKEKAESDKKLADEEAAKAAKDKEDKLFLAIQQQAPELSIFGKFDTGNMDRFVPKGDVSDGELLGALKAGLKMGDFSGWMIGDLVLELEKRGQLNVVKRLAEDSGTPYSKVYNDSKTSKIFPPDQRSTAVSFTIYREVANAKFTDEQRKTGLPALVNEVSEGKHTSQTIRDAVKKVQGKEDVTVLPEQDTKKTFIVIDPGTTDPEQQVQIAKGFPRNLVGGGVIILDPSTKKKFTNFRAKPENRWEELTEWKEATPEPTTPTPATTKGKKGKK